MDNELKEYNVRFLKQMIVEASSKEEAFLIAREEVEKTLEGTMLTPEKVYNMQHIIGPLEEKTDDLPISGGI